MDLVSLTQTTAKMLLVWFFAVSRLWIMELNALSDLLWLEKEALIILSCVRCRSDLLNMAAVVFCRSNGVHTWSGRNRKSELSQMSWVGLLVLGVKGFCFHLCFVDAFSVFSGSCNANMLWLWTLSNCSPPDVQRVLFCCFLLLHITWALQHKTSWHCDSEVQL